MKRLFWLATFVCLLVLNSTPIFAQFETASVLGYVRDASGAVLPNAAVSLVNQETKAIVTAKTSAQGSYEFTDVKIGEYKVTAQSDGFDLSATQPFRVTVNAHQRVDIALKIGSANQTVTVSDAAALLETDSSERGQIIGTREVENLPLNGRAYADLAALVPGVRRNLLENSTDSSRDASFNVNGQRSEFNNFLLDGVDNNAYGTSNQGFSNQTIPPSPDAIDEFRVETDNYSAEYGRSAGAVVNVSIRSGTNKFHGKAYDYIRNTVLNAVGPFTPPSNPLTGKPQKPTLIRNQFGGTFGGPIWKDHTFFFGDYEGTRQVQHSPMSATVPTANQNGTSALAIANGGYTFITGKTNENGTPIPLINPLTGQVYTNGVIPFSDPSVSSFAKGVLAALPSSNVPGSPYANNYSSQPADTLTDNKFDVRVDQTFSPRTTAFVRYSQHKGTIISPPSIQGPAGGNSNGTVDIFNQQIAGGVTHSFTQNSILDARFAFTRTDGGKFPYGQNLPSLMTGIPGLPTDPQVVRSLNDQSVNGFTQFGNQNSNPQYQNPYIYNPKLNYTFIHGRSTYKIGYEYQAIFTTIDDFNPTFGIDTYNGGFSFNGVPAYGTTAAVPGTSAGLSSADTGTKEAASLADFLFGARDTYQLNNFVNVHVNQRMHNFYFQDDIRVNSRLTVNAGLRYELVTPQWESSNKLANYDPDTKSLITATPGSIYNRALVNMPKLDFAPRFGLSFQATPKTVILAGYGLGYAQFNREGGENLLVYNLPAIVNTNIVQAPQFALPTVITQKPETTCTAAQAGTAFNSANPNPCFRTTSQGYPTGFTDPANVTAASNLSTQARYIPKNLPTGYVQSYHLTVQRQLNSNTTFEVAYVGEHGVKIQVLADLNQSEANPVTATCNGTGAVGSTSGCLSVAARRPISNFTTIEETLPDGFLTYNGIQTKLEHRTSHGLYLLNSFTWSRAQDNGEGHLEEVSGDSGRINLANPIGDRGPSGYNQPLNEILSLVYDLPYGKGRMFGGNAPLLMQELLGGWQVTAINSASSGTPVNITYSPNSAQSVSTILAQRPNQISNNVIIPKKDRVKANGNQSFVALNSAAFAIPDNNHPYGNVGRNSVRFDAFYQLDMGLHKQFPLYPAGTSFDFRVEAFNILNQTNYAYPQSSVGASTFGTVNAATTFPARILQFAGKIIF
ncbi:TonB-dependent receptor [Granulicella sp. WH15]|uniref:TonB-dependent receptor n=1 Tax=Granulicella sp. WH15 TaxID=2602070 RepID=UPI0013668324|nr:TonB-dependent receptor [Granulicella sp. WH15]QHN05098.1 TonB-dependent receptor [Granulicella sp. WH15]